MQDPKQCTYEKVLSYDEARARFNSWINEPKGSGVMITKVADVWCASVSIKTMIHFKKRFVREKVVELSGARPFFFFFYMYIPKCIIGYKTRKAMNPHAKLSTV